MSLESGPYALDDVFTVIRKLIISKRSNLMYHDLKHLYRSREKVLTSMEKRLREASLSVKQWKGTLDK